MDLYLHLGILLVSLFFILLFYKRKHPGFNVPPGKKGWPIIGETWDFVMTGRRGTPEKFAKDRMAKYSSDVFQTSLLGENMAVFCGAAGNKFLFSNENKCVSSWWPSSVARIGTYPEDEGIVKKQAKNLRSFEFLKPEALHGYIPIMDSAAKKHLEADWSPYKEVKVLPLIKKYTFALACSMFIGVKDPEQIKSLFSPFKLVTTGLISLPINFPGTAFNRALKGGKLIHERVRPIIKQRKQELLLKNKQDATEDFLTAMVLESDDSEVHISNKVMGLLIASYDTLSTAITCTINYLAEYPHVYKQVFKEQMEVANSKRPGELLNWDDIKKMRYSWCVACETMRLLPPVGGTFREALTDFTYAGFTIPKGWKAYWTVHSTHKNSEYFPDPEKFDPSRFEGSGPAPFTFVPFGGGPSMCPGKEYARLEILVFIHNLVTKFKVKKVDPKEKIIYNPNPIPTNGLLVQLEPIST